MTTVSYLTDEKEWSRGLSDSHDLTALREFVASWAPYVPDAQAIVKKMDDADYLRWSDGLFTERQGNFAGESFAKEFGALLLPGNLLKATMAAMQFKVPLGTALIRLSELKKLDR